MDSKLVLAQIIMLMYYEHKAQGTAGDSSTLASNLLKTVDVPDGAIEGLDSRSLVIGLVETAQYMIDTPIGEEIERDMLIQRLKLNCGEDKTTLDAIESGINAELSDDALRRRAIALGSTLNQMDRQNKFKTTLHNWLRTYYYGELDNGQVVSIPDIALKMAAELEPFYQSAMDKGPMGIEGVVGTVDFNDAASIEAMLLEAEAESSIDGILKTGWQAINRMMGWHGGFRRGDFVVIGALQHNYKTGFTLNLAKHFCLYNKPYMLDKEKKPLILHISAENQLTDNIMLMYSSLKENETKEIEDIRNIDIAEATKYIMERTSCNGYTLQMVRVNPSDFTYAKLTQLFMMYESMGYEIHAVVCDYLNMFSKAGCTATTVGSDVRDIFRRVRNFCAPRKILFITPHQISSEAKQLLRMGVEDFVKEIVNKGYYDSCRVLDQEVDVEILIHKVIHNGRAYLTCQRGKHRKSGEITPDRDLYTVLPFYPAGAVRDDINDIDSSLRRPGGRANVDCDGNDDGDDFDDMF